MSSHDPAHTSQARRPCRRHSFTLAIRRASRPRAGALRRRQPRAHRPPAQRWAPAVSGSRGIGQRATASRGALAAPRTAAADGSPRRQRGTLECAQRAIQRRRPARLRPTAPRRCGSCAAALGRRRRSRALPPRANGHGRGAWCERRNRAASARWAPRLPGQPASGLHPHALVRAAVDHFDRGRRGLWVRHARTHAQSNTHAARGLTVRRSPSGARVATWCHGSRAGVTGGRPGVTRWCLQCNTSWRGLGPGIAVLWSCQRV